jgi:hypothetical protein
VGDILVIFTAVTPPTILTQIKLVKDLLEVTLYYSKPNTQFNFASDFHPSPFKIDKVLVSSPIKNRKILGFP